MQSRRRGRFSWIIFFSIRWIAIDDKVSKADLEIFVDPLGKPLPFSEVTGLKGKADKEKVGDYVFGLKAQGRYNGEPLMVREK
ncbi:AsmA family protein [Shigella sonnei]